MKEFFKHVLLFRLAGIVIYCLMIALFHYVVGLSVEMSILLVLVYQNIDTQKDLFDLMNKKKDLPRLNK